MLPTDTLRREPAAHLPVSSRRWLAWALVVWGMCPALAFAESGAGTVPKADSDLPAGEQRELAERFAPVLVFHPQEKYFPTSPLFPLDHEVAQTFKPAQGGPWEERLGTSDERREYYESLSVSAKARLATVYYRAYNARRDDEPVIVIEYWMYYVYNAYQVRGNVFPMWIDGSHPNDLEHIHVVLQHNADGDLVRHEVYGSAHTGTMPMNRHRYGDETYDERGQFLVERGSHANAPDVDGDGLFTPGVDGSSGYKMLWGIRDRGFTWSRYNSSYMDARAADTSVVFAYGAETDVSERHPYRLVPVSELTEAFGAMNLTKADRRALFEDDRHWFRRLFGGDNGSSARLLMPPPRSTKTSSIGIDRFASTERGFLAGAVINMEQQGVMVGARYAYLLGGTYMPDLLFQADGVLNHRHGMLMATMAVTYPIDGSTTVMFGRAFVTDSLRFERRQWDWLAGVEFPVGHMRVYFAARTWGPITNYAQEVRIAYFFQ